MVDMRLLGVTDLAKRWNYTRQGIHQKIKQDSQFPKPVAIINKGILVFLEDDIACYESSRKELLDANYKRWYTHKRWIFKEKQLVEMEKDTGE